MFVRAYDKINEYYYKSIVYGKLNRGCYEKAILFNPKTDMFELVEYLDRTERPLKPLYEVIYDDRSDWVTFEKYKIRAKLPMGRDTEVEFFVGYADVLEDSDFMRELLSRGAVPREKARFQIRGHADANVWTYIQTQEDANAFLDQFFGFHDATLEKLTYEESDRGTRISAIFDNFCWFGTAELCFEGVIAMNLRAPQENCFRDFFEGCLLVNADESVFWADCALNEEDMNYDGTYIKALSLKWRKLEDASE